MDETLFDKFNDIEKRLQDEEQEARCYHRQEVEEALEEGLSISAEILKDYPTLLKEVEERKERKRLRDERIKALPKLTEDIFETLKVGDKIKIDNHKVTVYKKEGNNLICRLYRSKTKAICLKIGDRATITIGWN